MSSYDEAIAALIKSRGEGHSFDWEADEAASRAFAIPNFGIGTVRRRDEVLQKSRAVKANETLEKSRKVNDDEMLKSLEALDKLCKSGDQLTVPNSADYHPPKNPQAYGNTSGLGLHGGKDGDGDADDRDARIDMLERQVNILKKMVSGKPSKPADKGESGRKGDLVRGEDGKMYRIIE